MDYTPTFMMPLALVELPKREQAHPTFDTLYTLAKKLEAGQPAQAPVMPLAQKLIKRSTGATLY